MILPLKELLENTGNMYSFSCAAIKRVLQLSISGSEEIAKCQGKIVSLAIKQILEKKIQYRLEE